MTMWEVISPTPGLSGGIWPQGALTHDCGRVSPLPRDYVGVSDLREPPVTMWGVSPPPHDYVGVSGPEGPSPSPDQVPVQLSHTQMTPSL